MIVLHGTTRTVWLIGKYAVKTPILKRHLKHFLKGWIGNVDEASTWQRLRHEKLCPVLFSFFGLVNVMKRVEPIQGQFDKKMVMDHFKELGIPVDVCSGWKNFGTLNGRMVMTDYAVCRESTEECSHCNGDC